MSSEITKAIPGTISEVALELPDGLSAEEWSQAGRTLGRMGRAVQWWIGDWINYGEKAYGDKYTDAVEITGYPEKTLRNLAYVARAVEVSRRRDDVSFSHHAEIASFGGVDQERWLIAAKSNGWTKGKLRKMIREVGTPCSPDQEVLDGAGEDVGTVPTTKARPAEDPNFARLEQIVWWVSDCPDAVNQLPLEDLLAAASTEDLREWRSDFPKGMAALRTVERGLGQGPLPTNEEPKPFSVPAIDTERQRSLARASYGRVSKVMGHIQGYAKGLEERRLRIDRALAVAEDHDVEGWIDTLSHAAESFKWLERDLRQMAKSESSAVEPAQDDRGAEDALHGQYLFMVTMLASLPAATVEETYPGAFQGMSRDELKRLPGEIERARENLLDVARDIEAILAEEES